MQKGDRTVPAPLLGLGIAFVQKKLKMRAWVVESLRGQWVDRFYVRWSDGTQGAYKLIHNSGRTFGLESIDGRLTQEQIVALLCQGAIELHPGQQ